MVSGNDAGVFAARPADQPAPGDWARGPATCRPQRRWLAYGLPVSGRLRVRFGWAVIVIAILAVVVARGVFGTEHLDASSRRAGRHVGALRARRPTTR